MKTQEIWDKHYLRIAREMSTLSYAIRRKVGCVVVKDRQIISDGYNGTPMGFENDCEIPNDINTERYYTLYPSDESRIEAMSCLNADLLTTKPEVLHAEANAITKLAKSTFSSLGSTIYITDEPCFGCAKLIIQSGISRVVYWRPYRIHEGIELLKKAGINVVNYDNIELNNGR